MFEPMNILALLSLLGNVAFYFINYKTNRQKRLLELEKQRLELEKQRHDQEVSQRSTARESMMDEHNAMQYFSDKLSLLRVEMAEVKDNLQQLIGELRNCQDENKRLLQLINKNIDDGNH